MSTATLSRRQLFEMAGAGLLIVVAPPESEAQRGGRGGAGPETLETRVHIGEDGFISILSGKIEEGQGALTELAMAAAEELRAPLDRIRMVMGDTGLTPNDGGTAGSGATPRSVPQVRRAAAAARGLLLAAAAGQFAADAAGLEVRDGAVHYADKVYGYADLARSPELAAAYKNALPEGTALTAAKDWQVLGKPQRRLDTRGLVTGAHRFPCDIVRPGMLYGRVLRPPSYGATLDSVDLAAVRKMPGVTVVREGDFVGCAAPTGFAARKALDAISATARWKTIEHPSSDTLFEYLKQHASQPGRPQSQGRGSVEKGMAEAQRRLKATYQVAYAQHAPMEPRAAVAEWQDGRLTVWTGTSNPSSVRQSLAQVCGVPIERVRVTVPHFGGGFGGKHTGEAALEAARLAKEAGHPVAVHWTRAEEFMWAYFRPAALIEVEAGLDAGNAISAWDFTNYHSGSSAIDAPYRIPNARTRFVACVSPLRTGSYRVLAATANNFAREAFTDELAEAAGKDPLEFRLAHLDNDRIGNVLKAAAEKFAWAERRKTKRPSGTGIGLACGAEKNSVVAACCEVAVDSRTGAPRVTEFVQAFECGAILNPANLRSQVEGAIMMGLGPALREEILFKDGRLTNGEFASYAVPRFRDLPKLDVVLLDRKDLEPAGAGETPIIAIAPAIANAVFDATGQRVYAMPIRARRG
ncbi:MAG TPA: molybdopterin cofactor-binding domain-containing protein [Bryobacteraceae bacterium]|nr:molybdopterin cofactor-binding domain-containing protein [Bryobacteraceae bacterium]